MYAGTRVICVAAALHTSRHQAGLAAPVARNPVWRTIVADASPGRISCQQAGVL